MNIPDGLMQQGVAAVIAVYLVYWVTTKLMKVVEHGFELLEKKLDSGFEKVASAMTGHTDLLKEIAEGVRKTNGDKK